MSDFFDGWFREFGSGLDKMSDEECGRLFSCCAKRCSGDALKYLYRDLFKDCGGDLDKFFSRVGEQKGLEGKVVEPGRVYELIFMSCDCPLHTKYEIDSVRLCACSRQSMICVFEDLVPDRSFTIETVTTILDGSDKCRYKLIFE